MHRCESDLTMGSFGSDFSQTRCKYTSSYNFRSLLLTLNEIMVIKSLQGFLTTKDTKQVQSDLMGVFL